VKLVFGAVKEKAFFARGAQADGTVSSFFLPSILLKRNSLRTARHVAHEFHEGNLDEESRAFTWSDSAWVPTRSKYRYL
jgi:hypothetical protein